MGPGDLLRDMDRAAAEGWTFTIEREQQSTNNWMRYDITMIHAENELMLTSRATTLKGALAKVLMKWANL